MDAPVGPVGTLPDRSVEVAERWKDVSWFDGGACPGEDGPVVLLGHVDSTAGPAVFVGLPQVEVGAIVEAVDEEGLPVLGAGGELRPRLVQAEPTAGSAPGRATARQVR